MQQSITAIQYLGLSQLVKVLLLFKKGILLRLHTAVGVYAHQGCGSLGL